MKAGLLTVDQALDSQECQVVATVTGIVAAPRLPGRTT
jgi:hypothetical protein